MSWERSVARHLLVAALGFAAEARAAAYRLESRTEAQAYRIRTYQGVGPDRPQLVARQRLVQYLGLDVFELVQGEPLSFESSLRVFADVGLSRDEAKLVDGLRGEAAELLYAYVSYRGEVIEARVGRQVHQEAVERFAFDGVSCRLAGRAGLGIEGFAGLWAKESSLLGTGSYQLDGTREDDARRMGLMLEPVAPHLDDPEPVLGVRAFLEGRAGWSAGFGFRRSWLAGRASQERATADVRLDRPGAALFGAAEYDLIWSRLAELRLGGRLTGGQVRISGELARVHPTYAADSIFNAFATAPRDEARLWLELFRWKRVRLWANGEVDRFFTATREDSVVGQGLLREPASAGVAVGGGLGGALHLEPFGARAQVLSKRGLGGEQSWLELAGAFEPDGQPFGLQAQASLAVVADPASTLRRGTFFGASLAGSYRPLSWAQGTLLVEYDASPFTRHDLRLFGLLELRQGYL